MTMATNNSPAPAVIYARYSSDRQTEASIEGQLKVCHEFAERNGYNVIGIYVDRALSGTSDERPEFLRMIEDSGRRQFAFVICYALDRFARNRYDSAVYKRQLKKNGVRVLSARENITDDPAGVLMEGILESYAEYFSRELAQKVKRGMELNAEKGLSNGSNPGLGFKVGSDRRFYVDEQAAPVVVRIFEMYASGQTVTQIIDYLNHQQIKTSLGKPFNKNSLHSMLLNKRYTGVYVCMGREIPGAMPRIVSDDLFQRVGEIMEKNKKAPARARAKEEYLLTTKLFCGHCREMMTGVSGKSATGKVHNYYVCNGRKRKKCHKKNVPKDFIEDTVVKMARAQLTNENIAIIAAAVVEECEKEKDNPNMRRLAGLLRENEKATNNLLNAIEQGQGLDLLTKRLEQKQQEREELEKEVAAETKNYVDLTASEIRFFLSELRNGDINDTKTRRMLITVLVNAVYLYDNKLTVLFNASDRAVEVTESLIDDIEADVQEFVYEQNRCTMTRGYEPFTS
jgi:DNA invertase Pin-like site-specific DNA recombinase